jgi:hypothetical protein
MLTGMLAISFLADRCHVVLFQVITFHGDLFRGD